MRLGIFGGSFDPLHRGHLLLAECCRQQAGLDCVWFVPTAQQPLKPTGPVASHVDRLKMLELALEGHEDFELSTLEIDRGGVSYTVDTLRAIQQHHSDADLFLLMGADSLADFPKWHQPDEICRLATLVVVNRAGEPTPDFTPLEGIATPKRLAEIKDTQVNMLPMEISSSEIRRLIAAGGEWEPFVPQTVVTYIHDHRLYQ